MSNSNINTKYYPPSYYQAPIALTYNTLRNLMLYGAGVKEGQLYHITDRADTGVLIRGTSNPKVVESIGIGGFLNPDFQTANTFDADFISDFLIEYWGVTLPQPIQQYLNMVAGPNFIWTSTNDLANVYSYGQIVVHDGIHYVCVDDLAFNGSINGPAWYYLPKNINVVSLAGVVYKGTLVGYIEEWDEIEIDFENSGAIINRKDKRKNDVGCSLGASNTVGATILNFQWGNDNVYNNTVKDSMFDILNASLINCYGNIVLNRSSFSGTIMGGVVINNILTNGANMVSNVLDGGALLGFNIVENSGNISYNSLGSSSQVAYNFVSGNTGAINNNLLVGNNTSILGNKLYDGLIINNTFDLFPLQYINGCTISDGIRVENVTSSYYENKTASNVYSNFDVDVQWDSQDEGGTLPNPLYAGIIRSSDFSGAPTNTNALQNVVQFPVTIYNKDSSVGTLTFDDTGKFRFPSPNTSATIGNNNLDFITFQWVDVESIFIQTNHQNY